MALDGLRAAEGTRFELIELVRENQIVSYSTSRLVLKQNRYTMRP